MLFGGSHLYYWGYNWLDATVRADSIQFLFQAQPNTNFRALQLLHLQS